MKIVAGVLGGLVLAFIGGILFPLTFELLPDSNSGPGVTIFSLLWIYGVFVALLSKNVTQVFRKLLFSGAFLSFLFPISSFIYHVGFMPENGEIDVGYNRELVIQSGVISIWVGLIGLVMAIVFVVIVRMVDKSKYGNTD